MRTAMENDGAHGARADLSGVKMIDRENKRLPAPSYLVLEQASVSFCHI